MAVAGVLKLLSKKYMLKKIQATMISANVLRQ